MGFCSGSLFQPELMVIITGTVFSYVADPHLLHEIEILLGELWVFGGIILFSMLGSKTTVAILPKVAHIVPLWCAGVTMRFIGVLIGIASTAKARGCKDHSTVLLDSVFCLLCTLPRATIQGALGAVPLHGRFFASGYDNKAEVREFIFIAARLYILCTSVCGMITLNTFGPRILQLTDEPEPMVPEGSGDGADLDQPLTAAGSDGHGHADVGHRGSHEHGHGGHGAGPPVGSNAGVDLVLLDAPAGLVMESHTMNVFESVGIEDDAEGTRRLVELVAERYSFNADELECLLQKGEGLTRTDRSTSSLVHQSTTVSQIRRHQTYRDLDDRGGEEASPRSSWTQSKGKGRLNFRGSIGGLASFDAPVRSKTNGSNHFSDLVRRVFHTGSPTREGQGI